MAKAPRGSALELLALTAALAHAGAGEAGTANLRTVAPDSAPASELGLEEALLQGRTQLAAGRVIEALQAYHHAVARSPDSVEALNGVAVCYDRMGKFDTSRTFYETALGIDPQSALLLNNYGYSLYLQGERAEATRFLALALATGDTGVQATALRTLARIEADGRKPEPRPDIASPTVQQAIAQVPPAQTGQAQIVRTSAHEVRLVLGDTPPPRSRARQARPHTLPVAPAILADALGQSAGAILPVVALSAEEDHRIAEAETDAIRREAFALAVHAAQQSRAILAAQAAPTPAVMQAMLDLALGARPVDTPATGSADYFAPRRPSRPAAADPEWNRSQLLVPTRGAGTDGIRAARAAPTYTMLVAGVVPVHPSLNSAELRSHPAAEPITRKRGFEQPFTSDDARLNGFASRLHHTPEPTTVDEQVERLQALMARISQA